MNVIICPAMMNRMAATMHRARRLGRRHPGTQRWRRNSEEPVSPQVYRIDIDR